MEAGVKDEKAKMESLLTRWTNIGKVDEDDVVEAVAADAVSEMFSRKFEARDRSG